MRLEGRNVLIRGFRVWVLGFRVCARNCRICLGTFFHPWAEAKHARIHRDAPSPYPRGRSAAPPRRIEKCFWADATPPCLTHHAPHQAANFLAGCAPRRATEVGGVRGGAWLQGTEGTGASTDGRHLPRRDAFSGISRGMCLCLKCRPSPAWPCC